MIEYTVTGIVTAPGVLSAQANNIEDPEEVPIFTRYTWIAWISKLT
jgi:hypothetical protein